MASLDIDTQNTTEDDIIERHIDAAIEAQDGPSEPVPDAATQQGNEPTPVAAQEAEPIIPASTDNSAGGAADPATPGQQPGQQPTNKDARGPQDLVDGKTGETIHGGAERRLWGKLQTSEQNLTTVTQQNSTLTRERDDARRDADAYRTANTNGTQLGLGAEEQITAMRIMAQYKANPVAAIQYMLAEAKQAGHNIDAVAQGFDASAIQQMITAMSQPLVAVPQPQPGQVTTAQPNAQEANIQDSAAQEATAFFDVYPEARQHENLVASIVTDHRVGPVDAYQALQRLAQKHGLDMSQPLEPQLQAAQAASPAPGVPLTQPAAGQPIPTGRNNVVAVETKQPTVANQDEDFDDIIKNVMREDGYKI